MTNASYANYRYPFAGFWRRVLAHVIDVIAILLFLCFLAMVAAVILDLADVSSAPIPATKVEAVDAAAYLFFIAFWLLYRSLLESSPLQATIGKLALSIKVTDVAGQRISFLRAAARNLASLISDATLLIGYLMVAFTPRKRALHDMIAGCLVVKNDA